MNQLLKITQSIWIEDVMVNLQNDSDMEGLHIIADIVMRVSVCDITLFWYYLHNSYFNKRRFFTSGSSCFPIGNILKNDTSIFGIINQLRYIFSVFLNHVFYLFYIWYWWGFGWKLIGHGYHIFSTCFWKLTILQLEILIHASKTL